MRAHQHCLSSLAGRSPCIGTLEDEATIFLSSPMASMLCCRCIPAVCGPSPVRIHAHTDGEIFRTPTRVPTPLSVWEYLRSTAVRFLDAHATTLHCPSLSCVRTAPSPVCPAPATTRVLQSFLKYASVIALVVSFFSSSRNASSWSSPHVNF